MCSMKVIDRLPDRTVNTAKSVLSRSDGQVIGSIGSIVDSDGWAALRQWPHMLDDLLPRLEPGLPEMDVYALEFADAVLGAVVDDVVAGVEVFAVREDEPLVGGGPFVGADVVAHPVELVGPCRRVVPGYVDRM